MRRLRGAVGVAVLLAVGGALSSGGSPADSVRLDYLADANALRTVARFGTGRTVTVSSLGDPAAVRGDPAWLARARPLGAAAPGWARRMYARSLLVLHALAGGRTGSVIAGARDGWAYVWPRDASAVAIALSSAGYRGQARRIVRFLLRLDLSATARFHRDGRPVGGRAAQGDADGWVAAAARAVDVRDPLRAQPWRDRADYQEGEPGDYLGNAIASAGGGAKSSGWEEARTIGRRFTGTGGVLVRRAGDPGSGIDSSAAWAVRPFALRPLYPRARRSLLRLVAGSGRFGIVPSQDWDGGVDPWSAPTAWTAWSLAALGERPAALRLMGELRRAATRAGLLPERVDARTGIPTSTTPLAWSHAFAILALHQLWPGKAQDGRRQRPSQ